MGNKLYDYEVLEGEEGDAEDYVTAMQNAINGGVAWKMQGSVGRSMMAAIENGDCLLGKQPASDYWGNRIPSRDEVLAGTKGSYEYVAKHSGIAHADAMAAL